MADKPLPPLTSLRAFEAAARLLSGTAFNAALWVAASEEPQVVLPKAIEAFRLMAEGFLTGRA